MTLEQMTSTQIASKPLSRLGLLIHPKWTLHRPLSYISKLGRKKHITLAIVRSPAWGMSGLGYEHSKSPLQKIRNPWPLLKPLKSGQTGNTGSPLGCCRDASAKNLTSWVQWKIHCFPTSSSPKTPPSSHKAQVRARHHGFSSVYERASAPLEENSGYKQKRLGQTLQGKRWASDGVLEGHIAVVVKTNGTILG